MLCEYAYVLVCLDGIILYCVSHRFWTQMSYKKKPTVCVTEIIGKRKDTGLEKGTTALENLSLVK